MSIQLSPFSALDYGGATRLHLRGLPTCRMCRSQLSTRGFVHVTGLDVSSTKNSDDVKYVIGSNLQEDELGTWNIVNGVPGLVTLSGEFWLGMLCRFVDAKMLTDPNRIRGRYRPLLGPEGKQGCFLPCTEAGVEFRFGHEVAERMRDDYAGLSCMHRNLFRNCTECKEKTEDCGNHKW